AGDVPGLSGSGKPQHQPPLIPLIHLIHLNPVSFRVMKLGVISLGCDKATVDTEALLARFVGHGAQITPALDDADVILVNTCGFIDAANPESIDAMLAAAQMKKD